MVQWDGLPAPLQSPNCDPKHARHVRGFPNRIALDYKKRTCACDPEDSGRQKTTNYHVDKTWSRGSGL